MFAPVVRIVAALGLITVTTAMAGPGLPRYFPALAPGLTPCKPIVTGPEITCDWKGVDAHAVYVYYHDALPKAGYTILPGAMERVTPNEMGALGFKKGNVQGAISVRDKFVSIQVITGQ